MTLEEAQKTVDNWIKTYGVRYFSELTNMAVLTEEVGELARVMSRKYGDQSFKPGEKDNLDDENGVMNKSILEAGGDILVVSQFTLMASTKKGNRPSYIRAARHETAIPLYEYFCNELSIGLGKQVGTGEFGADMKVELLNDGPVTICMDTKNKE